MKQVLDCRHEHDSECGYTPATEGTPCTYVCEICHSQEKPQIGQDQCLCTEPCTGDKINGECPVCGEDFAACKGVLPAAPPDALEVTPEQVQEMIDDLPRAEELQAMTKEEQQEVYADLQAVYDAYEALTDGQKAEVTGAGIFESLFGVFNGMMNAAAAAGDFEVTGGTSGNDYSYADGVLTINDGAELTISTNGQTSDRIVIASGAKATVILNGVNIGGTFDNEESAIDVSSGAALNIILQAGSTNTIGVDYSKVSETSPGIHVPKDAVLVIQGNGFLSVKGGTGTTGIGSVGIGGKNGKHPPEDPMRKPGEDCGTVVILGKNVKVEGGKDEKPIGGGFGHNNGGPGNGTLTGDGVVAVAYNEFQSKSDLTLTIEGGTGGGSDPYTAAYGSAITLKAEAKSKYARALSAGAYNTVTFYVGEDDSGKAELGTVKVKDNKASLLVTLSGDTWDKGFKMNSNNTITAAFSGHSHLESSQKAVTLRIERAGQMSAPSTPAVSKTDPVTDTSVTLETMGGGTAGVEYGYETDASGQTSYSWQDSPAFEGLTPGMVYTFHTRYAGNDFYLPSAPSSGLKVVTIDYAKETIQFDERLLEVNGSREFSNAPVSNNGSQALVGNPGAFWPPSV